QNHIEKIASHIKNSKIVAIKSIGGFNLICDSTCSEVVSRLRVFKNRPSKPFAVMCKDALHVKSIAKLSDEEQGILCSKEAPIVVLKKLHVEGILSELVAPKIDRVGCLLPYSGLHHILFQYLDTPIVCSSANLSSEPIITTKEDIFKKLPFVDFVLDYDREIINGVDDSLVQVVNSKMQMQMLRLGRGYAPKVIKSSSTCKANILAVGASSKNAIALYLNGNIILSPHIGDLESLNAFEFFENTLKSFERFYNFKPDLIVHDMHPSYETTIWAKKQDVKRVHVEHHLAHIYACRAEFNITQECLGFSFDGTGYGSDGELRGGEVYLADERILHFKPIKLLGSHKAIKEPRRVALSMLFEHLSLDEVLRVDLEVVKAFTCNEIKMLHQSYLRDLNAPKSSSVGRLFDAIASFSNLLHRSSYEGESGLLCESVYETTCRDSFDYEIVDGVIELKIVESILVNDFSSSTIVSMFINTLVDIIVEISRSKMIDVILSGGVFQNRTLLELTCKALKKYEISYYYQQTTSINDGSIALGQINYALFTQN
ncbi:MAG: Sua5/YciO/YrdC/YwlC family protein, partial [Campylobacterota bacterium]|nr:Sua5/YciO/YrdC/YwlC family protein [Campylobacterota bacterium]